ncbi:condensin subunit cnd3 [Moniliophthora roreri MCA 2997]|uniref:Condensin subunit cnd3 n=1 Tax=Moniliophthora roreri (strain MCA 2997) TaxID=1381753 RepID=V2YEY8_MONRO|nr:condensin subunit cnd3 [Moniliophthora roreri MCA 2997]
MPGRVRQGPSPLEELPSKVANIFEQVQGPAHNHKKNFVALYKLHEDATQITQPCRTPQGEEAVKPIGEKTFLDTFFVQLGKVLSLKKGTYPADQVVKFISGYVKYLNDKVAAENREDDEEEDVLDIDSAISRFTERLVGFLLKGFGAKDKSVRYRVVQICAEIVINLGELDEDLYMKMRRGLLERLNDKEISVRVQAATALCKFARTDDSGEESNEDAESGPPLLDCLVESMTYDDAVDVRRTIVRNIPLTKATLSTILERTRDTDAVIRKLVYSHVLDKNVGNAVENGVTHPSTFTIAQRELIVRNGIQDRDPGVKAAASNLMVHWMDILGCSLSGDKDEEGAQTQNQTRKEEHLLKFLTKFDLSQEEVATIALQSIFETKPEIFQEMHFPPQYWATLSPEKAFLARVFVDHCIKEKAEVLKETALPEVTALAFRIQDTYNQLVGIEEEEEDVFGTLDDEARARRDDERDACELTLEEMLKLAVNLDYGDEIGRRKMYALMRDMLSREKLSERHVGKCLNVLQKLWPDERDLIRLIVEIVQNLRDPGDEEEPTVRPRNDADPDASFTSVDETPKPAKAKSRADMTPEEQRRADHIDLMCLILLEGLLERVNGALGDNSTLYGVYNEVIVPCIQHADPALREKATKCFGLLALISKVVYLESQISS